VAVVDRQRGIIAERSSSDTRAHAEVIGTFIKEALAEAGVPAADLHGVAIGMGPGPFTGLRVGIAAGKAFALGSGKPAVRVISHDAVAYGSTEPILVITDARRREVYWSTFSGSDEVGLPVRTGGPAICAPADLATVVPDFDRYRRVDVAEVSGGAVGMLAEMMYFNGRTFAPDEALYLREPDATIPDALKRVS